MDNVKQKANKIKGIKIIILFLVIHFIFYILHSPVHAQHVSLSISPPLLEVVIKPGKSILIAYTVVNNGDPVIITPEIVSFMPEDIDGNIQLLDQKEGPVDFSLDNSELKLSKPFFMKSKSSQQLLLRISAPLGAPANDYYYTFTTTTDAGQTINSSASKASAVIGANILISVTDDGNLQVRPSIKSFGVFAPISFTLGGKKIKIFESTDKIPVKLVVANNGRNRIQPSGNIQLKGNFGERANFGIAPSNILSNSSRLLSATPSASLDCRSNKKICKTSYSLILSGFFVGKYELSSHIVFADGKVTLKAQDTFYAIPLKLITAVIIASLLGYAILKVIQKEED